MTFKPTGAPSAGAHFERATTTDASGHPDQLAMARRSGEGVPWYPLCRLAIGFGLVPVLRFWQGDYGSDWCLLLLFLLALLALRLAPALVRERLPVSEELQTHWARQRLVARRFDSYQWRKVLWFGLGLAGHLAVAGRANVVAAALAGVCLLAGSLGELRWRRLLRSDSAVAALAEGRGRLVSGA